MWKVSVPDFTAKASQSASFDFVGEAPQSKKKDKSTKKTNEGNNKETTNEKKRARPDEPTSASQRTPDKKNPTKQEPKASPKLAPNAAKKRKILNALLDETKASERGEEPKQTTSPRAKPNAPKPNQQPNYTNASDDDSDSDDAPKKAQSKPHMSDLQAKMKAKLDGGRFRFINEKLYTTGGQDSFKLFQQHPELFEVYHEGYRQQVEKWPENPLHVFIAYLQTLPKTHVVADFGCGEAKLAQSVKQKVHSFDLVAHNKFITACDISNVPLKDTTVDVAIFSLSLMGTNFMDFLKEAHRVLKVGGILKIAEVKSRFADTASFVKALNKLGFDEKGVDQTNKMFVLFTFVKTDRKSIKVPLQLKPCVYKKR